MILSLILLVDSQSVFRGCFVCGATDYFGTNKCPVEIKGKVEKRFFLMRCGLISHKGGSIHKASPNNHDFDYY